MCLNKVLYDVYIKPISHFAVSIVNLWCVHYLPYIIKMGCLATKCEPQHCKKDAILVLWSSSFLIISELLCNSVHHTVYYRWGRGFNECRQGKVRPEEPQRPLWGEEGRKGRWKGQVFHVLDHSDDIFFMTFCDFFTFSSFLKKSSQT